MRGAGHAGRDMARSTAAGSMPQTRPAAYRQVLRLSDALFLDAETERTPTDPCLLGVSQRSASQTRMVMRFKVRSLDRMTRGSPTRFGVSPRFEDDES